MLPKGKIDLEIIKDKLNSNFGLDIKQNVLIKILQRMSKAKNGKYVVYDKGTHNQFILEKEIDTKEFDDNMIKIKKSLDNVVKSLKEYLNAKSFLEKYSEDNAKNALLAFLEKYNFDIFKDVNATRFVEKTSNNKENYWVAHFILEEHEKKSSIYQEIQEIQKGHFASNAIYFFMSRDVDDVTKRIRGTEFYLDTSILIDVLGLNYEQDRIATEEMLKLITQNGGKLVTFNYYIEELHGIITKFQRDIGSRVSLDLDLFRRENFNNVQIDLYLNKLELMLTNLGVSIINEIDYSDMVSKNTWHLDEYKLEEELKKNVGYKDSTISDALKNDMETIRAMAFLRGNPRKCSVHNCKCLFITDNTDIINTIKKLYNSERFKIGEIPFAMTDIDLTSYLWLSNAEIKSSLPEIILLESAYAAIKPSNEVLREACRLIENDINSSTGECNDDALLLRYSYSLRDYIAELTQNDSSEVTDDVLRELYRRQKNRTKKEIAIEYSNKYASQQKDLEAKEKILNEKSQELILKEDKLVNREKYVERINKNVIEKNKDYVKNMEEFENRRKQEVEEHKKLKADSEEFNRIKKKEYERCKKYSEKISQIVYNVMSVFGGILLLIIIIIMFYVAYCASYASGKIEWIVYLVPTICSSLGMLGYVRVFLKFAKKCQERIKENFMDRQIGKSNILKQI